MILIRLEWRWKSQFHPRWFWPTCKPARRSSTPLNRGKGSFPTEQNKGTPAFRNCNFFFYPTRLNWFRIPVGTGRADSAGPPQPAENKSADVKCVDRFISDLVMAVTWLLAIIYSAASNPNSNSTAHYGGCLRRLDLAELSSRLIHLEISRQLRRMIHFQIGLHSLRIEFTPVAYRCDFSWKHPLAIRV